MKTSIAILTENHELFEDITSQNPDIDCIHFRNVDSIRGDEYLVFLIDYDIFESDELIQFFLSKIRKKLEGVPVLMIIKSTTIERLQNDWFYDDFILYPFRNGEFKARIHRLQKNFNDENVILIGNLKINLKEYAVYLNNQKINLTYKEFELMRLFAENRHQIFSRKDLLSKIWGIDYIGGTRTVDVHIRRLRGKLGDEFNSFIETVRNVGYKCR